LPSTDQPIAWPTEAILEQCGFGVLISSLEGRPLLTNGPMRKFFGYSEEEFRALHFLELIHPEDRAAAVALAHEVMEGRRADYVQDRRYLTRAGVRWGRVRFSALRDAEGRPTHALAVIEDRSEVREAERRLASIVEHSADAIYIKDREGRYLLINPAGAGLVGRTPDFFLGKRDDEVFQPENAATVIEADRQVLETNAICQSEEALSHPTRGPVFFSTTKYPYRSEAGEVLGVIGISRDITARRLLEQELAEQNARLKELDRLKSAIVSAVSHEFRTPLTLIKGYTEFLAEGATGPVTDMQEEMLARIGGGVDRLERLVSDLLDISTIEAGAFTLVPGPTDLVRVLQEATQNLGPLAREVGSPIVVDLPPGPLELTLDAMRIEQVVANLVANALKFSPEGDEVRVSLRLEAERAVVAVRDRGIGIPADQQAGIFERFNRVSNGLRRGGTGLGLSIAKALVEAHGGTIGVESQPGQGSTFWFALPLGR
jgi:PAS domain S-box-containing protein